MSKIIYHTITTIKNTEKSQVYLATMEGQETPVIIKKMKTANPEIYKELQEIHNEHIPQIYALEWQEDELVVAEEYVDGETLEHYLKEELLTEEEKLNIALQLCEAVDVLHNCEPQIIHRDIKPSNILITEDKILKLIDFDASRNYKKSSEYSDTKILGTADYAAPEQFGYKQTDERSDIYSMGVVFEMLDFHGTGLTKTSWKRIKDICTTFDPKKRYKNVKSLANAIRRVMFLQKYQWYVLGGVLCAALLAFMVALWNQNPVQETENESESQTVVETQEQDVIDEEKLASIKQQLEALSIYVSEYYQGEMNVDFFFYSDFFENDIKVENATLTDIVNGEIIEINQEVKLENSIIMIEADYLNTLRPSYYKFEVHLTDEKTGINRSYEIHIRVYSEGDTFVENEYSLATNWLDYNYEQYDTLHILSCANTKHKITGLYLVNDGKVDPSQYQILYDGRAAELSASLLEQCKESKETVFEVEFSNGKRERLIIANPYSE